MQPSLQQQLDLLNAVLNGIAEQTGVNEFRTLTNQAQVDTALAKLNEAVERRVCARTAELAEANRDLTVKNQENEMFVYGVSHDLRSPLVSVRGFSKELGMVAQELGALLANKAVPEEIRARAARLLEEDMQESLRFIESGVVRLSTIIDALLRLSRIGRIEYQIRLLDMNQMVARVVDAMSGELYERDLELRVADLPSCHGDAAAIEQLFANLIGNALKYLHHNCKGEIEVGALPMTAGEQTYYVRDNGLGVPADQRDKIFQAFRRVHPNHAPGEGMGLAIVRRVIQRHGGRVWVESTEGQGSTFFVSLPVRTLAAGPSADQARPQERGCSHGDRINSDFAGGRR